MARTGTKEEKKKRTYSPEARERLGATARANLLKAQAANAARKVAATEEAQAPSVCSEAGTPAPGWEWDADKSEWVENGPSVPIDSLAQLQPQPPAKNGKKKEQPPVASCWVFLDGSAKEMELPLAKVQPLNAPQAKESPDGVIGMIRGWAGSHPLKWQHMLEHSEGGLKAADLSIITGGDGDKGGLIEPTPTQLFRVLESTPATMMYHIPPTFLQKLRDYMTLGILGILCLLLFLIISSLAEAS